MELLTIITVGRFVLAALCICIAIWLMLRENKNWGWLMVTAVFLAPGIPFR